MQKVEFTFDFLSPYSYLAWTWVRDQKHIDWSYRPVPMASLITHYETKGPAQIEPKRNYLFKDLLRKTAEKKIPFTTPKTLPFNSLYALRLALKGVAGADQREVIDVLYRAGWEHGFDIGNDDVLKELFSKTKLNQEELFARMESKEARRELKQNLEAALDDGLFGVPSFTTGGELFWGHDSILYLEKFLSGEDLLDKTKYDNFLNLFTVR